MSNEIYYSIWATSYAIFLIILAVALIVSLIAFFHERMENGRKKLKVDPSLEAFKVYTK